MQPAAIARLPHACLGVSASSNQLSIQRLLCLDTSTYENGISLQSARKTNLQADKCWSSYLICFPFKLHAIVFKKFSANRSISNIDKEKWFMGEPLKKKKKAEACIIFKVADFPSRYDINASVAGPEDQ